ncbi:MAG: tetratricopeptide repeat protein [Planctomycetes bacterium]|nr:tetratricopeptide repeat protein [Planctomycetota bacterium]
MRRLARLASFALVALLPAAAAAETVTIVRRDGQEITGELLEYTQARTYRVRSGEAIWEIPEASIQTVLSRTEAATPMPPPGGGPAPSPERRPGTPRTEVPWDLDFHLYVQTEVLQARRVFEEGLSYEKARDFVKAREAFRRARESDPWFLAARLAYANASIRLGDWAAATGELESVLQLDPKNELAHHLNVLLYERKGDPESANAAYRRMLVARYPTPEANYRLTHLYLRDGDFERAQTYWKRYVDLDPRRGGEFDEEAVAQRKAEAERDAGNFDAARTLLYQAMRRNPLLRKEVLAAVIRVHDAQAQAFAARGDFTGALDVIRRLAELDPGTADDRHDTLVRLHGQFLGHAAVHGPLVAMEEALGRAQREMSWDEFVGILTRTLDRIVEAATEDPARPALGPALRLLAETLLREEMARDREYDIRHKLATVYASLGDANYRAKQFELAVENIKRAGEVLPAEEEKYLPRIVEYSVAHARARAARRDYPGAMAILAEVGRIAPDNSTVRQGLDDVEFILLKVGLDAEADPHKKDEMLTNFLARGRPEEHVLFAKAAVADVAAELERAMIVEMRQMRRYYPLGVGNEWVYAQGAAEVRHRVCTRTYANQQETFEVVEEKLVAGATRCRKLRVVADAKGVTAGDEPRSVPLFRFPIVVGASWESHEGSFVHRFTYVSTGETVVTRSGRYSNCLKVEEKVILDGKGPGGDATSTSYHYYAPGVGLVRREAVGDEKHELELDLLTFRISKE